MNAQDAMPYIDEDGILVIPGECPDDSWKWWKKGGRSLTDILRDLNASREVWERYTDKPYPDDGGEGKDG